MSLDAYFDKFSLTYLKGNGFIFCLLVLFVCGLQMLYHLRRPKRNLPPGPLGLPLVGYLPFLGKEPFRTFDNLRKKYGNVFSLYMGRKYAVILGDHTAIKEALSKRETLDRPEGLFAFQPDGYGITEFNGVKWIEQRRTVRRQMRDLGVGTSTWEQLLQDEVLDFLQAIAKTKGAPVDIGKDLISSTTNNICSFVFGKRLPPGQERDMLNSSLNAAATFFSQAGLWNFFPWLYKAMVKLRMGNYYKVFYELMCLNKFVRKEIEIHKNASDDTTNIDFVSSYMEIIENRGKEANTDFNERSLIGNVQSLFAAGSETTQTSILWLILAMAAYPNVQRHVQQELDSVLGGEQKASWKGRFQLPYTYAAIMEGQRWKTTVPFGLARIATEDFRLCGYDVPKGSLIVQNLWAVHNDSRYWKDPEDFIPERFLQNDGKDINLKLESYEPFSYGKRRCPGDTVGLMSIFLYFTSIMQKYEVRVPNGGNPNLNGILGATYMPMAQELCFVSR